MPTDDTPPPPEDLASVTPGTAFSLRAIDEHGATILAGTVEDRLTTDPVADLQELAADAEPYLSGDIPKYVPLLALDATTWWDVPDDEDAPRIVDRSDRLADRPWAQPYLADPPEPPPPCTITVRDDGRLGVVIPSPVSNGHRVTHYAPANYGQLDRFTTGPIVDPLTMLSDAERGRIE